MRPIDGAALFTARVDARTRRQGRRSRSSWPSTRSASTSSTRTPARGWPRTAPSALRWQPSSAGIAMTKQRETREQVLELIEALEVGDAIPSERQLGTDLGVSRLTVRAALDELVREGHLTRRRGAGTFVAEPKVAKGMTITSFSDDMRQRGLTPGQPHARASGRSRRARGSAASCTSRRPSRCSRSSASASPTASRWRSSCCTCAQSLFPGLTARELEESSFYDLLRNRYEIEIVGGTQTVEPTVTSEEESSALGVPLHSPALLFERVTRRRRRHRRVHELDLPRRPLPPRLRARRRRPPGRCRSRSRHATLSRDRWNRPVAGQSRRLVLTARKPVCQDPAAWCLV